MDRTSSVTSRVRLLTESLGRLPDRVTRPALIIISGLPGTGKSFFAKRLADRIPAVILQSDALRKTLFPSPTYSLCENGLLFETIHVVIGRLLKQDRNVIMDATNLGESNREILYRIAEKNKARIVIAYLEAPPELIEKRLRERRREGDCRSDADWEVYLKMRENVEEIRRPHYVVDTSQDITPSIENIVKEVMEE